MLGSLFEFFKREKNHRRIKHSGKPLHVSRQIFYRSSQQSFFNNQSQDISTVFENVSKLPMMQQSNLSFCTVSSGALFVGFDKPKRVCGYGIFYPIDKLKTNRSGIIKFAQEHGLSVYVLVMKDENKCIQVRKPGKRYFLVDPKLLKLRRKHYVATPQPKVEFLPRHGR